MSIQELFTGNVVLSLVALLSVAINIYQFLIRRKVNRAGLRKEKELKGIEIDEMHDRHKEEWEQLRGEEVKEGVVLYIDERTEDGRNIKNLSNRQRNESRKLYAELSHLRELSGERPITVPRTKVEKLKFGIKRRLNKVGIL